MWYWPAMHARRGVGAAAGCRGSWSPGVLIWITNLCGKQRKGSGKTGREGKAGEVEAVATPPYGVVLRRAAMSKPARTSAGARSCRWQPRCGGRARDIVARRRWLSGVARPSAGPLGEPRLRFGEEGAASELQPGPVETAPSPTAHGRRHATPVAECRRLLEPAAWPPRPSLPPPLRPLHSLQRASFYAAASLGA
eukprot:353538-Chlamydomonas_euryale.AAC.5